MTEQRPPTMPTDSALEITTAIRAVPLSTPHARATQLQMYTRRHRRT